jgi:aminoglycoside phosphotransferase (APT) family kinase protein
VTNPEHVHAVLARWFPERAVTITQAGTGVSTPVFAVEVDDGMYYARLGEEPGERRDAEVAAHRILTGAGVPVPAIVRYESAPAELDRSIQLTSRMPGGALADLPAGEWLPEVGRAAGEALARINAVPVRGYGWVRDITRDGVLVAEHVSRAAWAKEYVDAAETLAGSPILGSGHAARVMACVRRWAALSCPSASHLAHGDFDTTHVYIDPASGAFTGIIDLGEIRGADRLYDLGHLLLHDGEAGRPTVLPPVVRGYAGRVPVPDEAMDDIRLQAIAIATRALAIQLRRAPGPYRDWLEQRLIALAS